MTDIVERLRTFPHNDIALADVMAEAADEIERLREKIKKLRGEEGWQRIGGGVR